MALKQVSPTDEFIKGLWRDNPVFIHMLGLCPALAVSNTAINALEPAIMVVREDAGGLIPSAQRTQCRGFHGAIGIEVRGNADSAFAVGREQFLPCIAAFVVTG